MIYYKNKGEKELERNLTVFHGHHGLLYIIDALYNNVNTFEPTYPGVEKSRWCVWNNL